MHNTNLILQSKGRVCESVQALSHWCDARDLIPKLPSPHPVYIPSSSTTPQLKPVCSPQIGPSLFCDPNPPVHSHLKKDCTALDCIFKPSQLYHLQQTTGTFPVPTLISSLFRGIGRMGVTLAPSPCSKTAIPWLLSA